MHEQSEIHKNSLAQGAIKAVANFKLETPSALQKDFNSPIVEYSRLLTTTIKQINFYGFKSLYSTIRRRMIIARMMRKM
jgi:hypothetical protein